MSAMIRSELTTFSGQLGVFCLPELFSIVVDSPNFNNEEFDKETEGFEDGILDVGVTIVKVLSSKCSAQSADN